MSKCAVLRADNYNADEIYNIVKKHFEFHGIENEISKDAKVVIKPNLLSDKEAYFSINTNPAFVFAIIRYLKDIGINDITVADCPGGSVLLFTQMQEVYRRAEYDFLTEHVKLNLDFESSDIYGSADFVNKKFNIINVIKNADYLINVPKLKTHSMTGITAGVKNLFGCIPGLQKPAFHARYPKTDDFSNMLVELAATVKPDFTIVDAIDIMEGNGPANGTKRHLGATFSSKDVFALDAFIAEKMQVPTDMVKTLVAAEKKGFVTEKIEAVGDIEFCVDRPLELPAPLKEKTSASKFAATFKIMLDRIDERFFKIYPQMNDKCILCRKCVTTCPMRALKIENRKVILNKKDCIGCLCCDEICPQGAVDIIKKFDIRKVK